MPEPTDTKIQDGETKITPAPQAQTPVETKVQPSAPAEPSPPPKISDEQISGLKDEITKDISGKVSEEVSKSVIDRIGDALGLTKKETKELPSDPEELKKIVDDRVQERLDEIEKSAKEAETTEESQRQEQIDGIIKGWHGEYSALAQAGKVPEVKNASDADDPGVQARRKLILSVGKIIEADKAKGIQRTPSLSEAFLINPGVLTGPPGADLPISGNTNVQEKEGAFTNKEIHGKTIEQLAVGE